MGWGGWGGLEQGKGSGPFRSTEPARPHSKTSPKASRAAALGARQPGSLPSCFLLENHPAHHPFPCFPNRGSALNPLTLWLHGGSAGTPLQSWAVLGATTALTDFCPFESPSEAPGSFFSPSLHIPGASRHPPLLLPWQPPPQHPLQQPPPQNLPPKASTRGDSGVPSIAVGSLHLG